MLEDIIEESWAYQEMVKKGYIKGRKQAYQMQLQALRYMLLSIVSQRFARLMSKAQQDIEQIYDPDILLRLIVEIAVIADEAEKLFSEAVGKR